MLEKKAEDLLQKCRDNNLKIVTAESCTGGMIAKYLTDIAGSSDVFERGFVTYSNEAKTEELGVDAKLIEEHGAVSEEVAKAMAEGALKSSHASISVAVTGVAGPDSSESKPVGLVYIATTSKASETICKKCEFSGSRDEIRKSTVEAAFALIWDSV